MNHLHIVRDIRDDRADAVIQEQRRRGCDVTLLLLHDAVLRGSPAEEWVVACRDDALARGSRTKARTVDYDEIVGMMFEADKVVCW